jgi:hypothetical protein
LANRGDYAPGSSQKTSKLFGIILIHQFGSALEIATGTERSACSSDDYDAHLSIAAGLLEGLS